MSLITEQALQKVPGVLTASLSNLSSVVQSLSNLQQTSPAVFQQFQNEISSLLKGFDSPSNILNSIGGLAQGLQQLSQTGLSPDNIQSLASAVNQVSSMVDNNINPQGSQQTVLANKTSVQQAAAQNKPSNDIWPSDLGKYWFAMAFTKYNFSSRALGGVGQQPITRTPAGSVLLPLPAGIEDTTNVVYSEFNVTDEIAGLAGGAAGVVAGAVGGAATSLVQSGRGGNIAGAFSNLSNIFGIINNIASAGYKVGSAYTGLAANPATTLLLQGPQLKTHQFQWRLSPNSLQDSKKLNDIINRIKWYMSPYIWGGAGWILGYPHMVSCYFYNQDQLYAFKPAMVTQFSVNYAPSGSPAFYKSQGGKGGYPTEIVMTLAIKELEAWLKEDYEMVLGDTAGANMRPADYVVPGFTFGGQTIGGGSTGFTG